MTLCVIVNYLCVGSSKSKEDSFPLATSPLPSPSLPLPLLPPQTTDPEDYRLIFRRPPGCAPSVCSFFAGVQTNENSSTFLDFYLEADANGWAAIGVSASANMVNYECRALWSERE